MRGWFDGNEAEPYRAPGAPPTEALAVPVAPKSIQRYTPRLGENPAYRANITAIMEPDFYNGEWVKYSDHLAALSAQERRS